MQTFFSKIWIFVADSAKKVRVRLNLRPKTRASTPPLKALRATFPRPQPPAAPAQRALAAPKPRGLSRTRPFARRHTRASKQPRARRQQTRGFCPPPDGSTKAARRARRLRPSPNQCPSGSRARFAPSPRRRHRDVLKAFLSARTRPPARCPPRPPCRLQSKC